MPIKRSCHLHGRILTPCGFVNGEMYWDDSGRIVAIDGTHVDESDVRDGKAALILPGFIDLHVHGGGGRDIMEGGDAARQIAVMHAKHGTTSLLATTMTASAEALEAAFLGLSDVVSRREASEARVLGVHLEGPYINAARLGAQPDCVRPLDIRELGHLNKIAPIHVITLAPELAGHLDAISALQSHGYRVQIGHSAADYETGVEAIQRGASGFTHLFNAMTAMHHRAPGLTGAALAHARYAEIIPDLLHVHPGAIRAALRAIPCLYCVTDSTAAAGMPDGEYRLGSQTVNKCMGGVRLADGTLAGSTLTMDQALSNLVVGLNLGIADASARLSLHAANYLGLHERGRLAQGCLADVVVLDRDLKLQEIFVEGEAIER